MKPRKRKLDARAIEELCWDLYTVPVVYRPRTDAERKQLNDLLATGTRVCFGLRDQAEREQYAARMAATAAADIYKRLSQPPDKERVLQQKVWLVLKTLLGEPLDGPNIDSDDSLPMLQSEKLYRRWSTVAGLHKQGLSWTNAYECASDIYKCTSWAGSPLTMKQAYVLVNRIRRTIERYESERERLGPTGKQLPVASKKLPIPV
jgi:hypothetical protein